MCMLPLVGAASLLWQVCPRGFEFVPALILYYSVTPFSVFIFQRMSLEMAESFQMNSASLWMFGNLQKTVTGSRPLGPWGWWTAPFCKVTFLFSGPGRECWFQIQCIVSQPPALPGTLTKGWWGWGKGGRTEGQWRRRLLHELKKFWVLCENCWFQKNGQITSVYLPKQLPGNFYQVIARFSDAG